MFSSRIIVDGRAGGSPRRGRGGGRPTSFLHSKAPFFTSRTGRDQTAMKTGSAQDGDVPGEKLTVDEGPGQQDHDLEVEEHENRAVRKNFTEKRDGARPSPARRIRRRCP